MGGSAEEGNVLPGAKAVWLYTEVGICSKAHHSSHPAPPLPDKATTQMTGGLNACWLVVLPLGGAGWPNGHPVPAVMAYYERWRYLTALFVTLAWAVY